MWARSGAGHREGHSDEKCNTYRTAEEPRKNRRSTAEELRGRTTAVTTAKANTYKPKPERATAKGRWGFFAWHKRSGFALAGLDETIHPHPTEGHPRIPRGCGVTAEEPQKICGPNFRFWAQGPIGAHFRGPPGYAPQKGPQRRRMQYLPHRGRTPRRK